MGFEEFCAAAISTYQLEAREDWDRIANMAFEYFEQEGNRVISIAELARVLLYTLFAFLIFPLWIMIIFFDLTK